MSFLRRWFPRDTRDERIAELDREIASIRRQLADRERAHAVDLEIRDAKIAEQSAQLFDYGRRGVDHRSEIDRRDFEIALLRGRIAEIERVAGFTVEGGLTGAIHGWQRTREQYSRLHRAYGTLAQQNDALRAQLQSVALAGLHVVSFMKTPITDHDHFDTDNNRKLKGDC